MTGIVQKSDLMIAALSLADPNFNQTVVLVCEHKPGEGTYGLILNRPIQTPDVVAEDFPAATGNTFKGGPVHPDTLQILHRFGHLVKSSHEIMPGLWIGGDPDELRAAFADKNLDTSDCRFFLGYAGWDGDQLASEFDMNAWIRVPGNADLIMNTDPERIWTEAVRLQAATDPKFKNYPLNPVLN